ncbi:hypothetical protein [Paractinoplanes rishiriensis]|uniref:Activator of Hsp90 ATPase 1 family protein n=1 Tax=Paractinoplanes rishiriensis TaxID=1050105 RepID=A0A919K2M6_9ACTN|nr:hypothetical protein [Actinoplanes rishiriensis]GIE99751.1 hypothetical protein Ari01nite_72160 [Actinoplanes rishiriensis]
MSGEFEVRWTGTLPGTPPEIWDAFTRHTAGWLWPIRYEPREGGVDGVVDYTAEPFLGVRTADALYRFFGRDAWGWPVGMSVHQFGGDVDPSWTAWLEGVR